MGKIKNFTDGAAADESLIPPAPKSRFNIRKLTSRKKDIQKNLAEVYVDGNGEIPDLSKLEKAQQPFWRTVVYAMIAICSVLLAAAIGGFFVFSNINGDSFTNENIALKIETPINIASGQETAYTVMITNKERVDLYNAKLELFYPDNFEYLSADPEAAGDRKNTWNFSVLKIGETQKITIKGKIWAALGSTQTFRGTLTFRPANFNTDFKQESIVDAAIASSVISLDVLGPEKTLANRKIEYIIKYKNTGEEDLVDLQLVADYPLGFVFAAAEPEADQGGSNIWSIDKLPGGGEGEIKISGDYSQLTAGGNQDFKARIQLKKNGDYYPQSAESFVTNVIKDQLSLQLIVNGSLEDQPINFGDFLVYSLNYKNTGQEELKNISVAAHLDSPILDWASLQDDNHGLAKSGSITWTGKEIPRLLKLGPNEEGEISWTIRVKDDSVISDDKISDFSVTTYASAQSQQDGELGGESNVKTKTIVNAINSDLTLSANARYYNEDNVALGSGPIQPKVGEESSFNIKLALGNKLHDIKDLSLVASLPQTVTWSDKENHNVGDLIYNEQANKVTWNIVRLVKSTNTSEVTFNVTIKPKDADFGRVLVLISEINLTAKDADTGAEIKKTIKAITTSFNDPILGQVSGIVE